MASHLTSTSTHTLPVQRDHPLKRQPQCDTTLIPANWKIYAGSQADQRTFDRVYSHTVFKATQYSCNFHNEHLQMEDGYNNGPYDLYDTLFVQDTRACSSATEPMLDGDTPLDHIVVLYDTAEPRFKENAEEAITTFHKSYPGAVITLKAVSNTDDIKASLNQQHAFIETHSASKPNVALYYSGHGIVQKHLKTINGDIQGQLGNDVSNPYMTEAELETYMAENAANIGKGFVIIDACGSGAFTD